MAVKPDAKVWAVKEQIVEDPASGLTLQFEVDDAGQARLRVLGDLPFGNRDFVFDREGAEAGAGTTTTDTCRPSWLRLAAS